MKWICGTCVSGEIHPAAGEEFYVCVECGSKWVWRRVVRTEKGLEEI